MAHALFIITYLHRKVTSKLGTFSGHNGINKRKHRNFLQYNTPQKVYVFDVVYLYTYTYTEE